MISRYAVFVDAGYLFAQGSRLIAGERQLREHLCLDIGAAVTALIDTAKKLSGHELLRIYWYDGGRGGTRTPAQDELADAPDVKLRLGQINSRGQQKGVDALIVTDVIDLARRKAIADAVLVTGDEDIRVGVVLAQQEGVRVHLIGIGDAVGNQSRMLRQEADTVSEWTENTLRQFLSFHPPIRPTEPEPSQSLDSLLVALIREIDDATRQGIADAPLRSPIPHEIDHKLLRLGRTFYGTRSLSEDQRRGLREEFMRRLRSRTDAD